MASINLRFRPFALLTAIALAAASTLFCGEYAAAQGSAPSDDQYLVKAGDTLLISVWKEEDLQLEVLIRPDGGFSFPLAGDVSAAGKTVDTIAKELSGRLERYIPDTVVTVAVTAINGNKIYVIGQVNNPGAFVMNPRIDVMQALSMAGGATAFAALNDIIILRRSALGQTALKFRYGDVERGRNLNQNIMLESGDVVVVP
jgi:polysaccharide export outer membrane protein